MTAFKIDQAGLEVWSQKPDVSGLSFRVGEAGLEVWSQKPKVSALSFRVGQTGLEVWTSVMAASGTAFRIGQAGLEVWISTLESPLGLFQTDALPSQTSVYTEFGVPLNFEYETVLLPDNEQMAENMVVESNITMSFIGSGPSVTIAALDNYGTQLNQIEIIPSGSVSLWGTAIWGQSYWGGSPSPLSPWSVPWTVPLVFKQAYIDVSGQSTGGFSIGNTYLKYQVLGYRQQNPSGQN